LIGILRYSDANQRDAETDADDNARAKHETPHGPRV
jgi:hypothetical protein